jgi:hypothetical protein
MHACVRVLHAAQSYSFIMANISVPLYPKVLSVSGCNPYTSELSAGLSKFGVRVPAEAVNGTFGCSMLVPQAFEVTVSTGHGQSTVTSISVGGRQCSCTGNTTVPNPETSGDIAVVQCLCSGQGLFQGVVVSVADRGSNLPLDLSSEAAPLVSFALPTVSQVSTCKMNGVTARHS